MSKPQEFQSDVLDAIAILTERTPGDVFYKIEAGGFKELAVEALTAFAAKFSMLDRVGDSDPLDDTQILEKCLADLKAELEIAVDPTQIQELNLDIDNIKQRIKITKS
jgi:hypothetical protein